MSESNWRFDGADNEPEGDDTLNEEPTPPGRPNPETGQPESTGDGTHPADREWLEELDQLFGPIGPQGFFLDEDEVDDEDEDDLWDDSPLPHHSNHKEQHTPTLKTNNTHSPTKKREEKRERIEREKEERKQNVGATKAKTPPKDAVNISFGHKAFVGDG